MTRFACLLMAVFSMAGCQTATKDPQIWVRTDGQSAVGRPDLQQEYQIAALSCQGEMAKVAGVAPPVYYSGIGGAIAAGMVVNERNKTIQLVGQGCMAEKGYVLTTSSQAEALAAQFRQARRKS